jgi:hypothetical protein
MLGVEASWLGLGRWKAILQVPVCKDVCVATSVTPASANTAPSLHLRYLSGKEQIRTRSREYGCCCHRGKVFYFYINLPQLAGFLFLASCRFAALDFWYIVKLFGFVAVTKARLTPVNSHENNLSKCCDAFARMPELHCIT